MTEAEAATAPRLEPVVLYGGAALLAVVVGAGLTLAGRVPGVATPGPVVEYGLPVARVLMDAVAVAGIGLSLLARLLGYRRPERTEPVMAPARRLAFVAGVGWIAATLALTVLQTAELTPGTPPTPGAVAHYVGSQPAGQALLLSAVCALAYTLFTGMSLRYGEKIPAELRLGVALFGLLPLQVTGHASDWAFHDVSMLAIELHVMAAAVWTGGLLAIAVFLTGHPVLLALTLPRFSRLATLAIAAVAVTGVVTGLAELAQTPGVHLPGALFTTRYGLLVLTKLALAAALALLGAHFRYRLLPVIARTGRTTALTWATAELAVMGLAYGIGTILGRAPVT